MPSRLQCHEIFIAAGDRRLVDNLTLDCDPGRVICILGPNGVGKTLTLRTLAGIRPPDGGLVTLNGRPIADFGRRDVAQCVGMLLQQQADYFPITALDAAVMGRYAARGFWGSETAADVERARESLKHMELANHEYQLVSTLSGGERRRLALATLLVQDPDIALLDEPTNHLDPLHRMTVLNAMRQRADAGKTVVASLHDPNLAAHIADDVLLLHGNGHWQLGRADDLLTTNHLATLFNTPFVEYSRNGERALLPANI